MSYKLYNGDCLEIMKDIPNKTIDLVLIDPPYNIGKDKWDKWDTVEEYVEFMGKVFKECERVLKDNGSFYFFHNDFLQIVELQNYINKNTNFIFKSLITWDKLTNADRVQFSNLLKMYGNQRNYFKGLTEYCLYYTFQDETPLRSSLNKSVDVFNPIFEYFTEEQKKTGLNNKQLDDIMGRKSAFSYFKKRTSHGIEFPTKKHYLKLQETGYFKKPYEELRQEYEELRQEYEGLRYTFNQPNIDLKGNDFSTLKNILRPYTTIYDYSRPKNNYKLGHTTPKPVELLEYLIKTSSNEREI